MLKSTLAHCITNICLNKALSDKRYYCKYKTDYVLLLYPDFTTLILSKSVVFINIMELATEYLYNIKARFAKVHLSDIGIVVACFMLIYVFRANDVFILRPVWKFDLQLEHGSLTSGASKPTIDDIDSDGYNEILFTDAKLNVTVMHYRYPMHKSKQLIHPDILATKLLEKYERDSSSILINTGFIAPPYTHETLRKQVISDIVC